MKKSSRLIILLITMAVGGYFLIPTVKWYFIYSDADRNEASLSGTRLKNEVYKRIDADVVKFQQDKADKNIVDGITKELNKKIKAYNSVRADKISVVKTIKYSELEAIVLKMKRSLAKASPEDRKAAIESFLKKSIEAYYTDLFAGKKKVKQEIIKLGLDLQGGAYAVVSVNFNHPSVKEKYKSGISDKEKKDIIREAVLKIENRINKFGLSETSIQTMEDQNKIIINLPGVKEASEVRKIVETVGVLEFKVVSKEGSETLGAVKREFDAASKSMFNTDGTVVQEVLDRLPPDTEVLKVANKDKWGDDLGDTPYLVVQKTSLLGDKLSIKHAAVEPDNMGRNTVNFTLDGESVNLWATATKNNIGRPIAIILDDVVLQSPTVQSEIPNGKSQITLGNSPAEELEDLAKILRSGSLNVPLEISEENTVGPGLGKDTIEKGMFAAMIGFALVIAFMIFYYGLGGFIADVAVLINVFFIIVGLGMFKGTLTLPGIAGVILTVGMAVDSNVIIYERVKEEFRSGKVFNTAIDLGYDKAFWTIFDANITTFIAAIGISIFGTGPIKGFAVTLCIGILSTLFTSLFVTRLMWDALVHNIEFKTLRSISVFRGK